LAAFRIAPTPTSGTIATTKKQDECLRDYLFKSLINTALFIVDTFYGGQGRKEINRRAIKNTNKSIVNHQWIR